MRVRVEREREKEVVAVKDESEVPSATPPRRDLGPHRSLRLVSQLTCLLIHPSRTASSV